MTPDRFLQKLVDVITMIKVPGVIIICVLSFFQVLSATFVGGYDKRAIFSTVVGLMIMAAIIFICRQVCVMD